MMFVKALDLGRVIAWSQADRIILTMAAACLMPFVLHAVPWFGGSVSGARWLPMFYAPLIASLCFRPHVALIVGIAAPVINHVLFGMPDGHVLPGMVFELVILNVLLAGINVRQRVRGWHVGMIFIALRSLSLLMFSGSGDAFVDQISHSLLMAWPGIVVLMILAEVVRLSAQRRE